jgi:hypothetical protein
VFFYTDVSEEHVASIFMDEIGSGNACVAREVVLRPKGKGKGHQ